MIPIAIESKAVVFTFGENECILSKCFGEAAKDESRKGKLPFTLICFTSANRIWMNSNNVEDSFAYTLKHAKINDNQNQWEK